MLDSDQIFQQLQNQFSFLSGEDITSVLSKAQIKVLQKDEIFIKEGDTSKDIAFIMQGIIRVYHLRDGVEYTCQLRTEKKVFGNFESVLLNMPSRRYFAALEETTIVTINYDILNDILANNHILAQTRLSIVEQNLAFAIQKHDEFILYSPEERYVRLLEDQPDIPQRVPQKYIASYLGITPVSLSRIRKRLQQ